MATSSISSERLLKINRRYLLTSAVGIAAAGIVPSVTPSEAALIDKRPSLSTAFEALPRNVSAPTARRLLEITRRNKLRRQANLPLLLISKELRRMMAADYEQDFNRFCEVYREAVWSQVLKSRRATEAANWNPSWIEGLGYQNEVYRILRERFRAQRQGVNYDLTDLACNFALPLAPPILSHVNKSLCGRT
jgi:hypothetical protein